MYQISYQYRPISASFFRLSEYQVNLTYWCTLSYWLAVHSSEVCSPTMFGNYGRRKWVKQHISWTGLRGRVQFHCCASAPGGGVQRPVARDWGGAVQRGGRGNPGEGGRDRLWVDGDTAHCKLSNYTIQHKNFQVHNICGLVPYFFE